MPEALAVAINRDAVKPTPTISIICCTHNRQSFVEQHFSRLAADLPSDVELIYALDNCTDGTRDYLAAHAADMPNVRIAEYRGPGGLFNCRNFGLEAAEGDYIHFLDDDDGVEPGYHRRACELLRGKAGTPMDAYLTGMSVERLSAPAQRQQIVAPELAAQGQRHGEELHLHGDLFTSILRGQLYFNCANALFSRAFFDGHRFRSEIRKSADWLYYLEAALRRELHFVVNESLQANYFVHASSMSVSPDKSMWNARIFDTLLAAVAPGSKHYLEVRQACASANFSAGFDVRRSRKGAALRYYLRALRLGMTGLALRGIVKLPLQY